MSSGTADKRLNDVARILPLDDDLLRELYHAHVRTNHLRLTMEEIFRPNKTTGTIMDELIRSRGVAADGSLVSWAEVDRALKKDPPEVLEVAPMTYRLLGVMIDKELGLDTGPDDEPSASRQRISQWVRQGVRPDERIRAVLWSIIKVLPEEQAIYDKAPRGESSHHVEKERGR
jgi:hypothetical protein